MGGLYQKVRGKGGKKRVEGANSLHFRQYGQRGTTERDKEGDDK